MCIRDRYYVAVESIMRNWRLKKHNIRKLVDFMTYTNDIAVTVRDKGKVKEGIRSVSREAKVSSCLTEKKTNM